MRPLVIEQAAGLCGTSTIRATRPVIIARSCSCQSAVRFMTDAWQLAQLFQDWWLTPVLSSFACVLACGVFVVLKLHGRLALRRRTAWDGIAKRSVGGLRRDATRQRRGQMRQTSKHARTAPAQPLPPELRRAWDEIATSHNGSTEYKPPSEPGRAWFGLPGLRERQDVRAGDTYALDYLLVGFDRFVAPYLSLNARHKRDAGLRLVLQCNETDFLFQDDVNMRVLAGESCTVVVSQTCPRHHARRSEHLPTQGSQARYSSTSLSGSTGSRQASLPAPTGAALYGPRRTSSQSVVCRGGVLTPPRLCPTTGTRLQPW